MKIFTEYLFKLVNIGALLFIAVYLFRSPIKKFLKKRSISFKKEHSAITSQLKLAQDKNHEYYEKLKNINLYMEKVMKKADLEAEKNGQEMLIDIEKKADMIINHSMEHADHLVKKYNEKCYEKVVDSSIDEAAKKMEDDIDVEANVKIIKDYLKRLREKNISWVHKEL